MASQSVIHSVQQQKSTVKCESCPQESFPQFAARQWAAFCFELLDAMQNAVLLFAWRYGCVRCNLKGNGLLCARHIGELKRDIRILTKFFAQGAL